MDFQLSPEQEKLRRSVREFIDKECPKRYARQLDRKGKFPHDLWEKIAQRGWLGLPISKEYGGQGGNIFDMVLFLEELSRGMFAPAMTYLISSVFGATSVGHYGNAEQKRFYLSNLARGEIKFAFALTEPHSGTDALGMTTWARRDGDDYIIQGPKIFVTAAQMADYILTICRTSQDPKKKSHGISMFVVDAKSPGVKPRMLDILGGKSVGTTTIVYKKVRVPASCVLGELDRGWHQLVHTLNNERISIAAMAVGVAQAAFDDALKFAKKRVAFDKPIGQFQSIQHYLANMAASLEYSRLLTYKAAWMQSLGKPCGVEATMAKMVASDMACKVTHHGMQILGGYSYMMGCDMQRYWRDSRLLTLGPISNEMARNFIAMDLGLPRSY
jgi:acyl-CoA dehydrogenase